MPSKKVEQIDAEVDAYLAVLPPGTTSAKLRKLGHAYLRAHPGYTRDGNYSDEVYKTANRVFELAEGVARAEKSRRRMQRQAAAYQRKIGRSSGS